MGRSSRQEDRTDSSLKLDAIIQKHRQFIESVLVRVERDPSTREDMISEVFLLAFQKLDVVLVLSESQQRAWFGRSARYLAANRMRKNLAERRMIASGRAIGTANSPSAEEAFFQLECPGAGAGVRSPWPGVDLLNDTAA